MDSELMAAINEAWGRVERVIEKDPGELERRLARRGMGMMVRPVRAWCVAVKATDRRMQPLTFPMDRRPAEWDSGRGVLGVPGAWGLFAGEGVAVAVPAGDDSGAGADGERCGQDAGGVRANGAGCGEAGGIQFGAADPGSGRDEGLVRGSFTRSDCWTRRE